MKRYKMKFGNGYPSMCEDPNGEYVKWDDFAEYYNFNTETISVHRESVERGLKEGNLTVTPLLEATREWAEFERKHFESNPPIQPPIPDITIRLGEEITSTPSTDGRVGVKEIQSPKKPSIPLCIDCKYYRDIEGMGKCTRNTYFSPVFGECYETTHCYDERGSFFKCGKKGKYFEPKEKGNK